MPAACAAADREPRDDDDGGGLDGPAAAGPPGGAPGHQPVFDLDPGTFATPPARESQLNALLNEAHHWLSDAGDALSHDDRTAVTGGLDRLRDLLSSDDAPLQGARALAVYCSGRDDLREAAVAAAVLQDADVMVAGEGSEVPPSVLIRGDGIGALLRF